MKTAVSLLVWLACLAPVAAEDWNVGILIYDGVFNTEFIAPYDVFQHAGARGREVEVFLVAPSLEPVVSAEGTRVLPDYTLEDHPDIAILVVPSFRGYESDLQVKKPVIEWIREAASSADWVLSNCWGAFYLAKAGLLDGRKAMTYPPDIGKLGRMFPALEPVEGRRFVRDGKFVTGGGGVASYENALYVVQHLWGEDLAKGIASGLVMQWDLGEVAHMVAEKP